MYVCVFIQKCGPEDIYWSRWFCVSVYVSASLSKDCSATMSQTGKMLSAGRVVSEVTGSAVSVTPLPDGL